jgi:hypothetical protein
MVIHREVPSLSGEWSVAGTTVFRNLDSGNALTYGTCSGSFALTQDADRFAGPLQVRGFGWNSDRFCTASGTLIGEVATSDSTVAARLEGNFQNWPRPSVNPSCEMIEAGNGTWTGTASGDAIRLQIHDTLRCAANVDGGIFGMPMANFERTVSLVFQR